jgi:diguanylate cyclase (GGDEF)-like protein/PAS domain S-box-containing protein
MCHFGHLMFRNGVASRWGYPAMAKARTLLLIDDNLAHLHSFQDALLTATDGPFYGEWVKTIAESVETLAHKDIWAIFLNLCLPGDQGLPHYDELRKAAPGIPTLVLAGMGDEAMVTEALRRGAKDFLLGTHIDSYSFARAIRHMVERETVEQALFTDRLNARVTLDSIGDAVLSTDALGNVTYLNGVAEKMTGWSREEALGKSLGQVFRIIDGVTREPSPDPMKLAIAKNRTVGLTANCILLRRDGVESAIEDSAAPIHDRAGSVAGAVIVFRDATTSRAMAGEMMHLAQHDNLTDLPNRVLLKDRLAQAIVTAHRNSTHVAVMFLDLDHFKHINDSLGHTIGDKLLQSVAGRLLSSVRSSDTVSRQGGDEFVLLLSEIKRAADAGFAAGKILISLAAPHQLDHHDFRITASIGVSTYPEDGDDAEALLKKADTAMYRAKQNGRNNYRVFSQDMIVSPVHQTEGIGPRPGDP